MRFATINIAYNSLADLCAGWRCSGWLAIIVLLLTGSANAIANTEATTQIGSSWVLAQNTSTTDGASSQTPRVISKPQTIVEDEPGTEQQTDIGSSSGQTSGTAGDVESPLLGLLPDSWQQKLEQLTGGTVDGSNDELIKKIALPVVAVVALLFLLPFFLVSLLKRLIRRRPVEPVATAAMQDRLADLDLDDIDLIGAVQRTDQGDRATPSAASVEQTNEQQNPNKVRHQSPVEVSTNKAATTQPPNEFSPESTAVTTNDTVDNLISTEHLQQRSADEPDLSNTSGLHDATVELSTSDLLLNTEQTKEPIAMQSASAAADTNNITPGIAGTKGDEPLTGMQQSTAAASQASLQPHQTPRPMTKFGTWLNDLPVELEARTALKPCSTGFHMALAM